MKQNYHLGECVWVTFSRHLKSRKSKFRVVCLDVFPLKMNMSPEKGTFRKERLLGGSHSSLVERLLGGRDRTVSVLIATK